MATGRRVLTAPGTVRIGGMGRTAVEPIPTAPFDPSPPSDVPATEQMAAAERREYFETQIIAFGDLTIGGMVQIRFRLPLERLRIIQRTATVTLALGYGRTPSAADFDDLVVGAIYFDFPTPPTRDLAILNMGTVAVAADVLVIAMAGARFEVV